jgi:hypothetical protein
VVCFEKNDPKNECANAHQRHISTFKDLSKKGKKRAGHTAQPHTLAAFLPWGSFAGASRPTRRKGRTTAQSTERRLVFFSKKKKQTLRWPTKKLLVEMFSTSSFFFLKR